MKVCFPASSNEGLSTQVYGHFGSAPLFLLVDSENQNVVEISNQDLHHAHGACNPIQALDGQVVDAIVVGGIGRGALMGLQRAGLKVYGAQGETIAENLACLQTEGLTELNGNQVCAGHSQGGGCGSH